MRNLPPLNALRAFEATARLGGVLKASEELHVTHGAVSRHVKQLEQWLGVELFLRANRSMKLTPQGRVYQQSIATALDLIREASQLVSNSKPPNTINLATTHSVATRWLLNKLPGFSKLQPDIEVWLTLEQGLTDFAKQNIDLAIRLGSGPWPNLHCVPLLRDRLVVVASPNLLARGEPLKTPHDLNGYALLHDQDPNTQWSRWCVLHQVHLDNVHAGPRFSSTDVLLNAAISGQGIALVNLFLANADIEQGNLTIALEQSVELGDYVWLVMPEHADSSHNIAAFCNWLGSVVMTGSQ